MKRPAPLTQGDVSGECVIYSAINAVRWLWPEHFSEIEACEQLYGELIGSMHAEGVKEMLIEGTESGAALDVARYMARVLRARHLELQVEPALSRNEWEASVRRGFADTKIYMNLLSGMLRRRLGIYSDIVAVVGLDDPWDHWTVVRGITGKSVLFYDSYAPVRLTRVRVTNFATGVDRSDEAIEIDAPATVIYRRLNVRGGTR